MDDKFLVGYRWVASGGAKICEQCAAMNDRSFYLNPKPGQLRYPDDIPRMPPLHPNCRCTLEPITDYSQVVAESAKDGPPPNWHNPYLHEEDRHYLGGYWKNDGRSIEDGPANWNYCGKNWTAGRNPNNMLSGEEYTLLTEPVNDLDCHCKDHDDCYERAARSTDPAAARKRCDALLIEGAKRLPEDPRLWNNPPDNSEDGKNMRTGIIIWFKYIQ
jgi:hypothetical protein